MSEHQGLQITQVTIGVLLLLFGYGYMYRRTHLDRFREDLFTLRDELFDYMWKHEQSFDMPAYQMVRALLNGSITIADQLQNPFSMLMVWFCVKGKRHHHVISGVTQAIRQIKKPEVMAHFEGIHTQLHARLLRYVFLEGWYWVVFKPIQIYLKSAGAHDHRLNKEKVFEAVDDWDNEVVFLGKTDFLGISTVTDERLMTASR